MQKEGKQAGAFRQLSIPVNALQDIRTQPAMSNFPVSAGRINSTLIYAYGAVKPACTKVYREGSFFLPLIANRLFKNSDRLIQSATGCRERRVQGINMGEQVSCCQVTHSTVTLSVRVGRLKYHKAREIAANRETGGQSDRASVINRRFLKAEESGFLISLAYMNRPAAS